MKPTSAYPQRGPAQEKAPQDMSPIRGAPLTTKSASRSPQAELPAVIVPVTVAAGRGCANAAVVERQRPTRAISTHLPSGCYFCTVRTFSLFTASPPPLVQF